MSREFPKTVSSHWILGSEPGTFGLSTTNGNVGINNVWSPYLGSKVRKGDTVGILIDAKKGTVHYMLKSSSSKRAIISPSSPAFQFDSSKRYCAAVTLKWTQSQVQCNFNHPFELWSAVEQSFGFGKIEPLFSAREALPFDSIGYLHNHHYPLPLAAASLAQTNRHYERAIENFEKNQKCAAPLYYLPQETLLHVFSFLKLGDLFSAILTCRYFERTAAHHSLWTLLIERDFHFGLGISSKLYMSRIIQQIYGKPIVEESPEMREEKFEKNRKSILSLTKERYKKRYHYKCGRYDAAFSIPTERGVAAMAYDEKAKNLFFAVSETFGLYNLTTGNVASSWLTTVGHIVCMSFCNKGIIVLGTDAGMVHVLDSNNGKQLARFFVVDLLTIDTHYDETSRKLSILVGTDNTAAPRIEIFALENIFASNSQTRYFNESSEEDSDAPLDEELNSKESSSNGSDSESENAIFGSQLAEPILVWRHVAMSPARIKSVAFLPHSNGRQFLVATSTGVSIWRRDDFSAFSSKSDLQEELEKTLEKLSLGHDYVENTLSGRRATGEINFEKFCDWSLSAVQANPHNSVSCMSISPEGWYAAVSTTCGEVFVFDARDGSDAASRLPVTKFETSVPGRVAKTIIQLHYECGGKLVTLQDDNSLRTWNQKTGQEEWAHTTPGVGSALICTEDFLAYGLGTARIRFLDFKDVPLPPHLYNAALDRKDRYLRSLAQDQFSNH